MKREIKFSTEKALSIADVIAMLPSSETIEANGIEGGLRDGELQMYWEGATWVKSYLQKQLLPKGITYNSETESPPEGHKQTKIIWKIK